MPAAVKRKVRIQKSGMLSQEMMSLLKQAEEKYIGIEETVIGCVGLLMFGARVQLSMKRKEAMYQQSQGVGAHRATVGGDCESPDSLRAGDPVRVGQRR